MRIPDNSMVICPACTHEFPAISVNDQEARRIDAARIKALEAMMRTCLHALRSYEYGNLASDLAADVAAAAQRCLGAAAP